MFRKIAFTRPLLVLSMVAVLATSAANAALNVDKGSPVLLGFPVLWVNCPKAVIIGRPTRCSVKFKVSGKIGTTTPPLSTSVYINVDDSLDMLLNKVSVYPGIDHPWKKGDTHLSWKIGGMLPGTHIFNIGIPHVPPFVAVGQKRNVKHLFCVSVAVAWSKKPMLTDVEAGACSTYSNLKCETKFITKGAADWPPP